MGEGECPAGRKRRGRWQAPRGAHALERVELIVRDRAKGGATTTTTKKKQQTTTEGTMTLGATGVQTGRESAGLANSKKRRAESRGCN